MMIVQGDQWGLGSERGGPGEQVLLSPIGVRPSDDIKTLKEDLQRLRYRGTFARAVGLTLYLIMWYSPLPILTLFYALLFFTLDPDKFSILLWNVQMLVLLRLQSGVLLL